jgi:hypothetical protein
MVESSAVQTDRMEWRCSQCQSLLGNRRNGKLYVKLKKTQLVIVGSVVAVCGCCAELNETQTAGRG